MSFRWTGSSLHHVCRDVSTVDVQSGQTAKRKQDRLGLDAVEDLGLSEGSSQLAGTSMLPIHYGLWMEGLVTSPCNSLSQCFIMCELLRIHYLASLCLLECCWSGARIEFKVVIRGPRGNRWEQGENRLLQA